MNVFTAWVAVVTGLLAVVVAVPPLLKTPNGRVWVAIAGFLALTATALGVIGIFRAPGPPIEVTVSEPLPGAKPVRPAKNRIPVRGTVRNLPRGHSLWIISQPIDGGDFFVVQGSVATRADGSWSVVDLDAGDPDDFDAGFVYYVVDAAETCDRGLGSRAVPIRRIGAVVPPDWKCRVIGPSGLIRFTGRAVPR